MPAGISLPPTTCGSMRVPEDRDTPGSRLIDVAYAVFHATAPHPAADPLVYLVGGPGGSALFDAGPLSHYVFSNITRGQRDLVLLDPRGTGRSSPSLDCAPEANLAATAPTVALIACHDRWVADGVDLGAYGNHAMAADADDLMRALGYPAYNVIGISYGAHVALTLLHDHPSRVRSVILDSTVPPNVSWIAEAPASFDGALRALSDACAAQPGCAGDSPDLAGAVVSLAESLDRSPRTVPFGNAPSGVPRRLRVDGTTFLSLIAAMLHNDPRHPDQIAALPSFIRGFAAGDSTALTAALSRVQRTNGGIARADYYSVVCREEVPFVRPAELAAATQGVPEATRLAFMPTESILKTQCAAWTQDAPNPLDDRPVYSRVPALVVAGEMDPVTPPRYGRMVAANLPQSTFLLFPGVGHGLVGFECEDQAMAAFLDHPGALLGVDCLAHLQEPTFTP